MLPTNILRHLFAKKKKKKKIAYETEPRIQQRGAPAVRCCLCSRPAAPPSPKSSLGLGHARVSQGQCPCAQVPAPQCQDEGQGQRRGREARQVPVCPQEPRHRSRMCFTDHGLFSIRVSSSLVQRRRVGNHTSTPRPAPQIQMCLPAVGLGMGTSRGPHVGELQAAGRGPACRGAPGTSRGPVCRGAPGTSRGPVCWGALGS